MRKTEDRPKKPWLLIRMDCRSEAGITVENAAHFIKAGASHVIVTSYVFAEGKIHFDRLEALRKEVGKEHLVLDLSCRPKEGIYYIVTNRWQKFTDQPLDEELMDELSRYCDEYLVHGVAVEGTGTGIDCELVQILSQCNKLPVTYAGGIGLFLILKNWILYPVEKWISRLEVP